MKVIAVVEYRFAFDYNNRMRAVYDYRGEQFGYIDGDRLFDMEDKLSGYVTPQAITDLKGNRVWHRDRDGLYDEHWVSIGYIGSEVQHGK